MCLEYQTKDDYFLIKNGCFYIGQKVFVCYQNKLISSCEHKPYNFTKKKNRLNEEILEVEPNSQPQGIFFKFRVKFCDIPEEHLIQKTKIVKLGFHVSMFSMIDGDNFMCKIETCFKETPIIFHLPVVFTYDDIQAIDNGSVVVEKFSILISDNFYIELGKKLNIESNIVETRWVETLKYLKENLNI
jgi:hypothetical protein